MLNSILFFYFVPLNDSWCACFALEHVFLHVVLSLPARKRYRQAQVYKSFNSDRHHDKLSIKCSFMSFFALFCCFSLFILRHIHWRKLGKRHITVLIVSQTHTIRDVGVFFRETNNIISLFVRESWRDKRTILNIFKPKRLVLCPRRILFRRKVWSLSTYFNFPLFLKHSYIVSYLLSQVESYFLMNWLVEALQHHWHSRNVDQKLLNLLREAS